MAKNAVAKSFALSLEADGWYRSAPPQDVDPPTTPDITSAAGGTLQGVVQWAASTDVGTGVAYYSVYYRLAGAGSWTLAGTTTNLTYTITGLAASTAYEVAVTAMDGAGNETEKSGVAIGSFTTAAPGTYPGTLTTYFATSYEGADPTAEGMVIWSPTGRDAYDHTVDNMVEHSALKAYKGSKSLRVQLTQHRFGSNAFPDNNDAYLTVTPNPYRHYRKAAGTPNQIAHRNELKWPNSGDFLISWETEQWLGLAVYLPGESDPDGDDPWRPVSWWSYSIGPQLHGSVGGPGSPLSLLHGSGRWPRAAYALAGIPWPTGAPRVRYKRGSDAYDPDTSAWLAGSTSAATLRMEWDTVAGASAYKVYRSVRAQGPFVEVTTGGNITVDTSARQYSETGLGTSTAPTTNQLNAYVYVTAVVGGVESAPSLLCPSGRHYWGIEGYGNNGARVDAVFGDALDDLGTWVRIVLRFRLSVSGTGYVQAWKNGTEVAWFPNTNLGHSGSGHHYWRHGIYANVPTENYTLDPLVAADWAARSIVYYDALRMCSRSGGNSARTDTGDPAYAAVDPAQYP